MLEYKVRPSFVKLVPRYFILLDVIINGMVSLTSLSECLLLVCRNATEFYILILYPAEMLNLLAY